MCAEAMAFLWRGYWYTEREKKKLVIRIVEGTEVERREIFGDFGIEVI